jgi:hypothetical protein
MATTAHSGMKQVTLRNATDAARRQADIARGNEQITRQRVEMLEIRTTNLDGAMQDVLNLLARGFWGRLRWLFTGK